MTLPKYFMKITKVVILIPPAVPCGPPPMNIRLQMITIEESRIPPISKVLNPAVLEATDTNREFTNLPVKEKPKAVKAME